VHVRLAADTSREKISIEFLDSSGLNISPQSEKKIEATYQKEDFRRARVVELGEIQYPSRIIEKYQEGFVKTLSRFKPSRPMKVVLDYMFQASHVILPTLLGRMGMDTVVLNAHVAEGALRNYEELTLQTSNVVRALNADFGVRMDANGERMTVVDEKGETIDHNLLMAAFVKMMLHTFPGKKIAVPVMAPSLIEEVAAQFEGQVIRSKATTRSLMEAGQEPDVILAGFGGQLIFPAFHGGFDGMMAGATLATLLALDNKKLSEVIQDLPPLHILSDQLTCPTTVKGTLMRLMLEKYGQENISTLDGVKLFDAEGWTLILPDPSYPKVHIYSNGSSQEYCQTQLNKYREDVQQMISHSSQT
jgi:mannose-1-phosphate guanylyltransferase/phosphomannomutase